MLGLIGVWDTKITGDLMEGLRGVLEEKPKRLGACSEHAGEAMLCCSGCFTLSAGCAGLTAPLLPRYPARGRSGCPGRPLPGNGRGRPSLGRSRLRVPGRCGENGGHQAGPVCGCVGLWGACAGLFGAAGVLWGRWGRLGSNAVPAAGGLAEEVDEKVLHAAFIPFGDITDIQIPLDYETGACRGSGGGRPAGWAAAP